VRDFGWPWEGFRVQLLKLCCEIDCFGWVV
jgi:hypothetical protein